MTGTILRRPTKGTLRLSMPKEPPPPEVAAVSAMVPPTPDPADAEERAWRKAENLRQERELQREARARRAQRTNALLTELRGRWPQLFARAVPLAVGINKAILTEMGEAAPSQQVLGRALNYWAHSRAYLEAIAAGTHRVALDGSDAGAPTEDERAHASEELVQIEAQRRKKLGAAASRPANIRPA